MTTLLLWHVRLTVGLSAVLFLVTALRAVWDRAPAVSGERPDGVLVASPGRPTRPARDVHQHLHPVVVPR
jgi:hypothetical protein